jgi:hypothetical protein
MPGSKTCFLNEPNCARFSPNEGICFPLNLLFWGQKGETCVSTPEPPREANLFVLQLLQEQLPLPCLV